MYKIYLSRLVGWKYVKYIYQGWLDGNISNIFIKVGWMEIYKIYSLRLVGW